MAGAPWNGLFYLATLQFLLLVAGAVVAVSTDDMLWRTLGFVALVTGAVFLVRTIRHAVRLER